MSSSCNPWTVAQQAPVSMGFPRQEHWNGLPFPTLRDLSDPGIEPTSPALADRFFATEPPGKPNLTVQFSSVQSLSHFWFFATPWTTACQASLSITNSRSLLKLRPIESVMPSNHLNLWCPPLFPPSIFPSIWIFFKWVSSSHQMAKVLEFQLQHQSFQWIFRTDLL